MQKGFTPILVLIILLIVVGGYIISTKTNETQQIPQNIHPSPMASSISTLRPSLPPDPIDPATGWRVYTDSKYGFTFKYPEFGSTYKYPDLCSNCLGWPLTGDPWAIIAVSETDSTDLGNDRPANGFEVSVGPNPERLSLKEYVSEETKLLRDNIYSCGEFKGTEIIEVNNVEGIHLICSELEDKSVTDEFVFQIPNSQQILIFTRMSKNKGSFEVFNQILSTFKFTN